jgi:hypothetical protein
VLDFLDLVGLAPDRLVGREHRLEQTGPLLQLVGQRLEIVVELFFARDQVEPGHSGLFWKGRRRPDTIRRTTGQNAQAVGL